MQFPTTLLTSVSVTHESRKKRTRAKEQGGLGGGVGEMLACLDLSKATCEF